MSFRGAAGTTAGYYVPQALGPRVRAGVAAWQELQTRLRELAEVNRRQLWASGPSTRGPTVSAEAGWSDAFVQRSLVEVLLPDGDKLWDPVLGRLMRVAHG
jgi:hypothetical protein